MTLGRVPRDLLKPLIPKTLDTHDLLDLLDRTLLQNLF